MISHYVCLLCLGSPECMPRMPMCKSGPAHSYLSFRIELSMLSMSLNGHFTSKMTRNMEDATQYILAEMSPHFQ